MKQADLGTLIPHSTRHHLGAGRSHETFAGTQLTLTSSTKADSSMEKLIHIASGTILQACGEVD